MHSVADKSDFFEITIEPVGKRVKVSAGSNLLSVLQEQGIGLVTTCGGNGTCGACKVATISGEYSEINQAEREKMLPREIAAGIRLACQVQIFSEAIVHIPAQSLSAPQRLQLESSTTKVSLNPSIVSSDCIMDPPSLNDLRSDEERVKTALLDVGIKDAMIPQTVRKTLSNDLRSLGWRGKFVLSDYQHPPRLIGFFPPDFHMLGIAFDIGTTKLAGYLVDMVTGEVLDQVGEMNPQIAYGEDVVSRIAYAVREKDGRIALQSRLISKINEMIMEMCHHVQVKADRVISVVLVGNTAMHHLACGLPVKQLGEAPFVPAVSGEMILQSDDLGLETAPGAEVYFPPNVAGYIGADHLAMQIATEAWRSRRNVIALDIGTNTEISLTSKGRVYCCSCASGPAFEGAHILFGMRAARGAIERVAIGDEIQVFTIGDVPPIGICGSGILDAIAEMKRTGIIDQRGIFQMQNKQAAKNDLRSELVLVPKEETGIDRDIVITRSDVNEIQLAKAAIQTGWKILLEEAKLSIDEIDEFIIAGAFGTYLDINSAIAIGMFPDIPLDKFKQVGNAAGAGARQMLLSRTRRKEARICLKKMKYIELTVHSGFSDIYFQSLYL